MLCFPLFYGLHEITCFFMFFLLLQVWATQCNVVVYVFFLPMTTYCYVDYLLNFFSLVQVFSYRCQQHFSFFSSCTLGSRQMLLIIFLLFPNLRSYWNFMFPKFCPLLCNGDILLISIESSLCDFTFLF